MALSNLGRYGELFETAKDLRAEEVPPFCLETHLQQILAA
jgi:hypothetical protein